MPVEKKTADRTKELRQRIVDEVHAGMRLRGLSVPVDLSAQHSARRRFILDAIAEDEELYPDWLWAQLALMEAEQTPRAKLEENFRRIDSILERIRALSDPRNSVPWASSRPAHSGKPPR